MTHADATVQVCFASLNTRRVSELCLRSMRALAGYPFELTVGDCGSTDGSIAMFEQYAARGVLDLEVAPEGRSHGAWLDHWLARVDSDYVVFCDSDVEFRRRGWLAQMVARARETGAALVATRIQAEGGVPFVHPVTGAVRTLAPRPEPWLMLIDVRQVRGVVTVGFGYRDKVLDDGHKIAYDTSAAFYESLREHELPVALMPAEFAKAFRHYGGLTWQGREMPLKMRAHRAVKSATVLLRLARSRMVHDVGG